MLSRIELHCHSSAGVPPVLQLTATLSLLGSGGFQHSVGYDYLVGMSQSTISKIASNVLKEMETKLCPRHINFEPENSAKCKEWFLQTYKIPGGNDFFFKFMSVIKNKLLFFIVIGCIDGTHIGLQKPTENEHMFFNRKGFHSLNAMVVSKTNKKVFPHVFNKKNNIFL